MLQRTGTTTKALGVAFAAALVLAGCSSDGSDEAADASSTTASTVAVNAGAEVEIEDFRFLPSVTTIEAGQFVQWTNNGDRTHLVTQAAEADTEREFKSDNLDSGQSFQHQFGEPGSYAYICAIHPDEMQGTIVVE